jgi:hypothetical protein
MAISNIYIYIRNLLKNQGEKNVSKLKSQVLNESNFT